MTIYSLDFQNGTYTNNGTSYALGSLPGWSYGRAGTAYSNNTSGSLTAYTANTPRVLSGTGLIVENSATNLCTLSYPGAVGWAGTPSAATGQTDNYGSTQAVTLTFTSGSQSANYWASPSFSITSGTTYTISVWMKCASGTQVVSLDFYDGTNDHFSPDKTVTTTWQRFSFTFTATVTSSAASMEICTGSGSAAATVTACLAQAETGSAATTNIVTTGASATRAADAARRVDREILNRRANPRAA